MGLADMRGDSAVSSALTQSRNDRPIPPLRVTAGLSYYRISLREIAVFARSSFRLCPSPPSARSPFRHNPGAGNDARTPTVAFAGSYLREAPLGNSWVLFLLQSA